MKNRDQMRSYALRLQPSARFLRTLDIWLLGPRHDVKRQKTALFYRKRLCVIHSGLWREPVCFSSGIRSDQLINCLSRFSYTLLSSFTSETVREGLFTSRRINRSLSAEITIRVKLQGDDGFTVPLRVVHVDKFGLSFAGNRVCLSLSRHHCAAAAYQIGTERQHWTARYRLANTTQVSTRARADFRAYL